MAKLNRVLCVRSTLAFFTFLMLLIGFSSAKAQHFTLTTPASSMTLATQEQGIVNVTVTPVSGFSGEVVLSCSSLPEYASCVLPNLSAPANLSGGAVIMPLTINTSEIYAYKPVSAKYRALSRRTGLAILLWPAAFALFAFTKKNRKLAVRLFLFLIMLYPVVGLTGCQNTYPHSTPPGTYNIQIQGVVPPSSSPVTLPFKLIVTP